MVRFVCMRSLVLDTNGQVKELEQSGFTRTQAEAITKALNNLDTSALSTKTDIHELKIDLIKWMVGTHLAYAAIIVGILGTLLTSIL